MKSKTKCVLGHLAFTTLTRVAANFGFMLTVMNRKNKCGNTYDV